MPGKKKSRVPTLLEFLNPLSLPPDQTDAGMVGPTWGDVVVPPDSGADNPPAREGWSDYLLRFVNPVSAPPGETADRPRGIFDGLAAGAGGPTGPDAGGGAPVGPASTAPRSPIEALDSRVQEEARATGVSPRDILKRMLGLQ